MNRNWHWIVDGTLVWWRNWSWKWKTQNSLISFFLNSIRKWVSCGLEVEAQTHLQRDQVRLVLLTLTCSVLSPYSVFLVNSLLFLAQLLISYLQQGLSVRGCAHSISPSWSVNCISSFFSRCPVHPSILWSSLSSIYPTIPPTGSLYLLLLQMARPSFVVRAFSLSSSATCMWAPNGVKTE